MAALGYRNVSATVDN
ncbi:hypothetical protein YPPY03_0775, partial [Yersinia pestis PY-03]